MGNLFKTRLLEYISERIKESELHKDAHGFHEGLEPYLDGRIIAFKDIVKYIQDDRKQLT